MTSRTPIVLLGLGLGVLMVAGRSGTHAGQDSPRARADALRALAVAAQRNADRSAQVARDLAARWSAADAEARRQAR